MSNKSFAWNFSKKELIEKLKKQALEYEDDIDVLTSVKRVYKKDGKPFQNWSKNFTSDKCTITESRYDANWIELHYISRGKYLHVTLYLNDRDPENIWENIQVTIQNNQNNLNITKRLLVEINNPETVCGQFVETLEKIKDTYRKMGDHKRDDSTERTLYYALYDYLG